MKEQIKIYKKTLKALMKESKVDPYKIERFKEQIKKMEEQIQWPK